MTISDSIPDFIQYLQGGIIINFGIQEIPRNDNFTRTQYQFNSVRIELTSTKDEIINSLIRYKYPENKEFALINNYNIGIGLDDYKTYQDFRAECKNVANSVLLIINQ